MPRNGREVEQFRKEMGYKRRVVEIYVTDDEWTALKRQATINGRPINTEVAAILTRELAK